HRVVTGSLHLRGAPVTRGGFVITRTLQAHHNSLPQKESQPMTFSIRRALGVAVVAAAADAVQLAAQAPQAPQVTVGSVAYTQFLYQLKDSGNHFNNFDITRAYVNVLGKVSGGVG